MKIRVLTKLFDRLNQWNQTHLSGWRAYGLYVLLAVVFISPILFAGVDYIDDTSRRLEGSYQWGSLGRVLTELLMHIVTFSFGDMVDVGNLAQLLAIPVMAGAGLIVARIVSGNKPLTVGDWLIGAIVVVNPLTLPNLSFRYDSLSMILAGTLALLAAYVVLYQKGKIRYLCGATALFSAAALYQSMIMLFPVAVAIGWAAHYVSKEKKHFLTWHSLLGAISVFIGVGIAYFGMTKLFHFSNLVGQRNSFVSPNFEGVMTIRENYRLAFGVLLDFVRNPEAKLLIGATCVVALGAFVWVLYKKAAKRPPLETIAFIATPLILLVSILGPFALMTSMIVLQLRTLTAAIGAVLFLAVFTYGLAKMKPRLAVVMVLPVCIILYSINLSFVYGSALRDQRRYDEYVATSIVNQISNDKNLATAEVIYIGGVSSYPMMVQNQIKKRPVLARMDIAGDNTRWFVWNGLKNMGIANMVDLYSGLHSSKVARDSVCSNPNAHRYSEGELYEVHRVNEKTFIVWQLNPFDNTGSMCDVT